MLFLGKQRETLAVLAEGSSGQAEGSGLWRSWVVAQGSTERLCICLYLLLDQDREDIFLLYSY